MTHQGLPDLEELPGTSLTGAGSGAGLEILSAMVPDDLESDPETEDFVKVFDEVDLAAEPIKYSLTPPPPKDAWTWIRNSARIGTVIDIGANTGEYAEFLDSFFRPTAIYAFEPLASCQPRLRELAERLPHLKVFQVALADEAGEATFWENQYGPSSSLLHVSEYSKRAFPHTANEAKSTVSLARLDEALDVQSLARDIFIKIDVQGVEDRVIRGGRAVFSAAEIVLIEMSFVPMYERQPIFDEIHDLMRSCGLQLAGLKNQIDDEATGQPLFAHCFYRRSMPVTAPAT